MRTYDDVSEALLRDNPNGDGMDTSLSDAYYHYHSRHDADQVRKIKSRIIKMLQAQGLADAASLVEGFNVGNLFCDDIGAD